MKRALFLGPLLIVLAACTAEPAANDPTVTVPQSPATEAPSVKLPAAPKPTAEGTCPYLDSVFVEDTNGQHLGDVKISAGDPPACFFYRPDGNIQLTVRVYSGEAAVAKGLVDQAAPVKTSNPAQLPGGWSGGAQPTDHGAVYAVAKGSSAVVVTTNQKQTIKAKLVTQEAVTTLGL